MLYVIIAILMFGILIAVHEFGHFITAKMLGVRVNEFAIGMGPTLLKKQKGETLYSLRAFPVGGFCAMEGEDDASDDPKSFQSKAGWKKLVILLAGAFMNFLTGFLIVLVLVFASQYHAVPVVAGFLEGAPLAQSELKQGDQFLSIDGHKMLTAGDASVYIARAGEVLDIEVLRDGQRVLLKDFSMPLRTFMIDGKAEQKRGITIGYQEIDANFFTKLKLSAYQTADYVRLVWMGLGDLVTGKVNVTEMSGPIGIVGMISDQGTNAESFAAAATGIASFVAFIAVNLAVMNLLPIPALDGGRIFFLAVNGVFTLFTQRKLDPKYEGYVNVAGFVCLIGLMIVVAFSDVLRLFGA